MKIVSILVLFAVVKNVSPNYRLCDGSDGPFEEGDVICLLARS